MSAIAREGVQLRLAQFIAFCGIGALMPYFGLLLEDAGLSAWQIAQISIIAPILKLVIPPAAGLVADLYTGRGNLIRAMNITAVLTWPMLLWPESFVGWALVWIYMSVARGALSPFLNAAAMDYSHRAIAAGYGHENFGRIRLWGSLGFIAATAAGGLLADAVGIRAVIHLYGVMLALTVVACWPIDRIHQPARRREGAQPANTLGQLIQLLRTPAFLMALVGIMLVRTSEGGYNVLYTMHVRHLGYSNTVAAILWSIGVFSEVALFRWLGAHVSRLPMGRLELWVAIAAGSNVLRWALLGTGDGWPTLLTGQLLHGISFGMFYLLGIELLDRHAPADFKSTIQGIYDTVAFGLSALMGQLASGWVWDHYSPQSMFLVNAIIALLGTSILFGSRRRA